MYCQYFCSSGNAYKQHAPTIPAHILLSNSIPSTILSIYYSRTPWEYEIVVKIGVWMQCKITMFDFDSKEE
jgi:hypothetical protein